MAKVYVAYGSNLNMEQMRDPLPYGGIHWHRGNRELRIAIQGFSAQCPCYHCAEGRIICARRCLENSETG